MKKKNEQAMSLQELELMIERYFDCTLNEAEELQLRTLLASTTYQSEAIDEARFTMGFMKQGMEIEKKRKGMQLTQRAFRPLSIAASVIVVFSLGLGLLHMHSMKNDNSNSCYAYVNGERMSNDQEVMALIENDFGLMKEASSGVDNNVQEQLATMGEALKLD